MGRITHTGALKALRLAAPQAVILATAKAAPMLQAYYGITDNVRVVATAKRSSWAKDAALLRRALCPLARDDGDL
jgi:flavorubredoxin